MAFEHEITYTWGNGGAPVTRKVTAEAGQEINIDETITGATSDVEIDLALDVSQMKSLFILADGDLTLETNGTAEPEATIELKAGEPLAWQAGAGYFANPLGDTDVTSLFASNAGESAVRLQMYILIDPTV